MGSNTKLCKLPVALFLLLSSLQFLCCGCNDSEQDKLDRARALYSGNIPSGGPDWLLARHQKILKKLNSMKLSDLQQPQIVEAEIHEETDRWLIVWWIESEPKSHTFKFYYGDQDVVEIPVSYLDHQSNLELYKQTGEIVHVARWPLNTLIEIADESERDSLSISVGDHIAVPIIFPLLTDSENGLGASFDDAGGSE